MKTAFVASEVVPFAKTGGLADVSGALPKELSKLGTDIKIFMPKYDVIDELKNNLSYNWNVGEFFVEVNGREHPVHLFSGFLPNSKVEVYFIDSPHYFHRDKLYTNQVDEDERFILFSKAALESMKKLNWTPDVIHCNDWQTGLIPYYIKENYKEDFANTASIFTIHNIGYQGVFPKETLISAELKPEFFYPMGPLEFYDKISFLKIGIVYSDLISTVSPTYAKEILTEEYGAGMDGILRSRKDDLYGILNGVDYNIWSPEKDHLIERQYSLANLENKNVNKRKLLEKMGLPFREKTPVIGIISRLVSQKGFDLIAEIFEDLMKIDLQAVLLGSGEDEYEEMFEAAAKKHPKKIAAYIGFNNELSHMIEAGADMFLMPSQYEPCGLNQIYSLKYGTVPIVRKTGGLADTVKDWDENIKDESGNGFAFEDYSSAELLSTITRAVSFFADKKIWTKIVENGMNSDFSWKRSAENYLDVYNNALYKKNG